MTQEHLLPAFSRKKLNQKQRCRLDDLLFIWSYWGLASHLNWSGDYCWCHCWCRHYWFEEIKVGHHCSFTALINMTRTPPRLPISLPNISSLIITAVQIDFNFSEHHVFARPQTEIASAFMAPSALHVSDSRNKKGDRFSANDSHSQTQPSAVLSFPWAC